MTYEELLQQKKAEVVERNKQEFKDYILSSSGQKKVANLVQKFPELNGREIVNRAIQGDTVCYALLTKDPTRQNYSENTFFEYTGLERLPQTGPNAIRFGKTSKAADFKVKDWYGTQKYINNGGGAQDNQLNDAVAFANDALKNNKKVILVIDGEYGRSKITKLISQNENCKIYTADELKNELGRL